MSAATPPRWLCDLCTRPIDGAHVARGGFRFHRDCGTEYGRLEAAALSAGGTVVPIREREAHGGAVMLKDEAYTPEGLVRIFADGTAWLYVLEPHGTRAEQLALGEAMSRVLRARLSVTEAKRKDLAG